MLTWSAERIYRKPRGCAGISSWLVGMYADEPGRALSITEHRPLRVTSFLSTLSSGLFPMLSPVGCGSNAETCCISALADWIGPESVAQYLNYSIGWIDDLDDRIVTRLIVGFIPALFPVGDRLRATSTSAIQPAA